MKVKLEGGRSYQPKADDPVICEDHHVTVKWGDLSLIQKLAVKDGIDMKDRCILLCKTHGTEFN
jgi:hypothetical protein